MSITANPTSIASGGSSTLTVTATNAAQVTITGTDGSSYTLSATGGTQSVSPTATTTYTATATGTGGKTTATATVTLAAAPTVSITANPTSIASGGSSTLTVTATNATQVTISGTNGSSYTLAATGGTQSVSPTATTTYTATATGAGGKTTAAATVTLAATPTVSITANPTSIASGGSSTLTVTATNATTGDHQRNEWQQLYPLGDRRNTIRQPHRDHNLHCNRHRNGWQDHRYRDRHGGASADREHHCQPNVDCLRGIVHINGDCHQRHAGDDHGNGWQQLYPAGDRRNTIRQPDRDHDLHRYRHRNGWQDHRYRNRNPGRGADCEHHCQPHVDCLRGIIHIDRNCHQCHADDDQRNGWQQLYPLGDRRNTIRQPDRHHDLHRYRHRNRWQDNRYCYRHPGCSAHRDHHCQPHFDCLGWIVHVNCDCHQCHAGDNHRNGWQQLYALGDGRNTIRQPDGDHDLHGNRHRNRWQDHRYRDRHPGHGAHRRHQRQTRFDHFRRLVHADRDGYQRHAGDGDRNGRQQLYPRRRPAEHNRSARPRPRLTPQPPPEQVARLPLPRPLR